MNKMASKTKCQKGYRYQDGKCIQYVTRLRSITKKSSAPIKIAEYFILGLLIVLSFLFAINLGNKDVLWALGFNIIILLISFVVYKSTDFEKELSGIPKDFNKNIKAVGIGIIAVVVFLGATWLVPGLSLGYPYLPGTISTTFKWFLINIVSPLSESIFFLGVVYAFFFKIFKNRWASITLSSIAFASFHLGAYILGFYQYPDFVVAFSVFWANVASFLVAFAFNFIAGWIITRPGMKNLIFGFVFHFGLNFINYTFSIVTFSIAKIIIPLIIP